MEELTTHTPALLPRTTGLARGTGLVKAITSDGILPLSPKQCFTSTEREYTYCEGALIVK